MRLERPASLAELVAAQLRKEIVEGAFALGESLSEAKIGKRYEVSRTPVREAFARLELEGLVRTEPQFGTFVFTIDRGQFALLSEVRSALEGAALAAAWQRQREALLASWRKQVAVMRDALGQPDPQRYSAADGAFHDAIFTHAENPYFDDARQVFSGKMAAIRNRLSTTPEHMRKSFAEHEALLGLLEDGRVDEARARLDRHICDKGATFWSVPEATPKSRRERLAELSG